MRERDRIAPPSWAGPRTPRAEPAEIRRSRVAGCGNLQEMASNVVNLNRFRKRKLREAKAKQAETNRIRHGRTQAEKDRERAERERAERAIEGKRLENATTPAAPSEDPDEP
jgi:hypothetical protein